MYIKRNFDVIVMQVRNKFEWCIRMIVTMTGVDKKGGAVLLGRFDEKPARLSSYVALAGGGKENFEIETRSPKL